MCAGKTTTANLLLKHYPKLFRVCKDKIKWCVSGYSSEVHTDLVNNLLLSLAKSAWNNGYSLVIESDPKIQKDMWKEYKKLAQEKGVKFLEINFEAPLEILEKRFQERLEKGRSKIDKFSVKTKEEMWDRYKLYRKYKKSDIPLINSNRFSPQEITDILKKMIEETQEPEATTSLQKNSTFHLIRYGSNKIVLQKMRE